VEFIMKKTISLVVATLAITAIGCAAVAPLKPMRGTDVPVADAAPEVKPYIGKTPGVGTPQLFARTFIGQPPLVPHNIEKYVPLTAEENACLDCHITDELRGQKIPKMGVSHFSPTRKAADGKPAVDMTRFQCDSCHVPQVNAKELVDSRFVGVTK
jgi:cytochrome c-type protein NapB